MQVVDYTTTVDLPLERMWAFISDFTNWAPMVKGYQSHEMINDRESIWILKAQFGSFSRVSKFHTTITEWVQPERVAFELKGINEQVTGFGVVKLQLGDSDASTNILAQVGFNAGGAMGPLINKLVKPWVKTVAEELVVKLIASVSSMKSPEGSATAAAPCADCPAPQVAAPQT